MLAIWPKGMKTVPTWDICDKRTKQDIIFIELSEITSTKVNYLGSKVDDEDVECPKSEKSWIRILLKRTSRN